MAHIVSYILCIALTVPLTSAQDQQPTFLQEWQKFMSEMTPDLNSSCVAEGCPELKSPSLCPRTDDTATFAAIINTANRCMTKPMCGFVMDPDAIPATTFKPEGSPGFGNASVCSLLPGGTVANFSHAQVTDVSRTQNQVKIDIFIPDLTMSGRISCDGGQTNMSYDGLLTFNFTIVYNGNDVRIDDPKLTTIYYVFNTLSPQGDVTHVTQFSPQVASISEVMLVAIFRPFLTNTYKAVFEVASQNCPQ